ncbi:hypothetical protein [Mucilaginibacter polytrichastri]|uniref:Uncharacterized protein n=1 Tax=Mucilaginibacter polytrichastri TaxID=1302689 RepID=A0A1Q5ZVK4_9SPHI|nr:hypothetical protein [Mucilaginibacter polytrichastri]OKS85791.1 hypothetical protein RG47T_1237 [Mucilaginibacter polytrichastri]SFS61472.1 hypothetical protein SAMN04487890_102337 [Mucilaginibacter polytrichastri]
MKPIETTIAKLLTEQHLKKAALDMHIQFDFLGFDNTHLKSTARYECMKILAARIIQIEGMLDIWAAHVYIPDVIEVL